VDKRLLELQVENFRSLRDVTVPLGDLNVLVGPNGAGKTNMLEVFTFLGDIIRTDLHPALDARGGFDEVVFRGADPQPDFLRIGLKATWTANSSLSDPDEYSLRVDQGSGVLERGESFEFQQTQGRERVITIEGERAAVEDSASGEALEESAFGIQRFSSGLSLLPRLSGNLGSEEVSAIAARLASFRVFDVDVDRVRTATQSARQRSVLSDNAANLASFLWTLRELSPEVFLDLVADARSVLPQLEDVSFEMPDGSSGAVVLVLRERGLRRPTLLREASYGTVRLLGLLALLHDPNPPALTCVEEIDHGLHPQALELIVARLREASERTQFIIATHSPALADRLEPRELVVCERAEDGSSLIPAISAQQIERVVHSSEGLPLGELWFSGALGGSL
jgi:predicted ATPase